MTGPYGTKPYAHLSTTPPVPEIPVTGDLWGHDRYSDLLVPDPQGQKELQQLFDNKNDLSTSLIWKGRRIPFISGSGSLEETVLKCFYLL